MNASSSEAEEEKEEHPKVDGEKDPDFAQVTEHLWGKNGGSSLWWTLLYWVPSFFDSYEPFFVLISKDAV